MLKWIICSVISLIFKYRSYRMEDNVLIKCPKSMSITQFSAMSVIKVDKSPGILLGEAPHWDAETQSLLYVDVFGELLLRYVPAEDKCYSIKIDERPSIIIPIAQSESEYVVTQRTKVTKIKWDGVSSHIDRKELVAELDFKDSTYRQVFNDGKVDPCGKLWIGSVGWNLEVDEFLPQKGTLYNLDSKQKKFNEHVKGITMSNGLDWIGDKLYFIDSMKKAIDEYTCDENFNKIVFSRTIFSLVENNVEGIPDGMTADADGYLWVAVFGSSRILKIDPKKPGTLVQTVLLPTPCITSLAFGGPNLDELYVTTASINPLDKKKNTDGGYLYKIAGLGTKGLPMRKVVL